jgi:hypothetical protein
MEYEDIDKVSPFDLLDKKNYTDQEIRDQRYQTCLSCEDLFMLTRTCKHCGCFMAAKTWLKDARCPLEKW